MNGQINNNIIYLFLIFWLFILLTPQTLIVATDAQLAEAIGSLKRKISEIYKNYENDFSPNIRSILKNERQNFFEKLTNLTDKQFHLMEMIEKKWEKMDKIFLIESAEKIFKIIERMDSEKREEFAKFGKMAENATKMTKILALTNNAKFEQLILALFNALKGTERAEYAKHFEKQSKAIHVYSIYMKYAKEKVDEILGKNKKFNWEKVEKYDKKLEKILEFMATKFAKESKEKLEEFIVDLVDTCKINTSYRQKAGSLLINYKDHFKNVLLEEIPSIFEKKKPIENLIKQLTNIIAEYSEIFLKNWLNFEKIGGEILFEYRAFIWKQISNKIIKEEEKIELDKFMAKLFERRQFFELEKYDKNFEKLLEIVRQNKSRESKIMQIFIEIPEIKIINFRKFLFKNFLAKIEEMEKNLIKNE